jgi:hypothetical protein
MTKELGWFDSYDGRRYSHEWPGGTNGSPPWGSFNGNWPGIASFAPNFGQSGAGQSNAAYGNIRTMRLPNFESKDYEWFQAGRWVRFDNFPLDNQDVNMGLRAFHYFDGVFASPPFGESNYGAARGWGMRWITSAWEVYYAWGNAFPGQYHMSGVNFSFTNGQWYWVEHRVKLNSFTSGEFILRIDGVEIYSVTGIKTFQNFIEFANGWVGSIHDDDSWEMYVDDEYVMFADSDSELEWLDQSAVQPLQPNGAGDAQDWSVVGAPNATDALDNLPYDQASYVQTSTLTGQQTVLLNFENIATSPPRTIHGLKVVFRARKQRITDSIVRPIVKIGGTVYEAGDGDYHLAAEWKEYFHIWEVSPATGLAWTAAEINAAQFGFRTPA